MGGLVRGQVVSSVAKWQTRMTETIHSGHFMVSDFEPESEAQDEEYEVGMPIPETPPPPVPLLKVPQPLPLPPPPPHAPIDGSLAKLFQCMTLAYRQKLTSPKWNRFKGVRLRWKDKIRLNNVIWRCWHMQFIMKKKTLVCQFASPLDVDAHNKPEAVVMEGKYWKRKLSTVAAEYKKWRLFYRNRIMGWTHNVPSPELHPVSLDGFDWNRSGTFGSISSMIFDDDLLMDFTDTLFSSLSSNQPFAFPNPREIARAGIADFIQPGLVQLQPNLEDFMDTLEPLQDYVNSKLLPPVPEELESFEPPDSLLSDDILPGGVVQKGHDKGGGRGSSGGTFVPTSFTFGGGVRELGEKGNRGSSRHDLFAKPVGKPRGRSRSGGGGAAVSGGRSQAPPSSQIHHQHAQHPQQHSSAPSSSSNGGGNGPSNTLLSHLLTNSAGSGQFSSGEKMGGGLHTGPGLNLMLSPTESRVESVGGGHGGQPSSGRWSPKSESLANLPMNFGMGLGGGSSEGGSPPGVPSPPMGPPFSSGPSSPAKPFRLKSDTDRVHYKEHRRVCHINAEQKRRCNIKNGFDTLHSLIPQLSHNPNAKVSKAAMLQKGAEYIRQLKLERAQLKEEIENHRQQVDNLNTAINSCQSMLPATGAPVSRQRTNKMKEMFEHWIRIRTNENWKFWIFSILIRPLLDSYNNSVSTASVDELCRTVLAWVDQHCSLVDLRPVVLNSLRYLCTTTDVLSNPANLPEEAYKAISQPIPPRDSKGDQR